MTQWHLERCRVRPSRQICQTYNVFLARNGKTGPVCLVHCHGKCILPEMQSFVFHKLVICIAISTSSTCDKTTKICLCYRYQWMLFSISIRKLVQVWRLIFSIELTFIFSISTFVIWSIECTAEKWSIESLLSPRLQWVKIYYGEKFWRLQENWNVLFICLCQLCQGKVPKKGFVITRSQLWPWRLYDYIIVSYF